MTDDLVKRLRSPEVFLMTSAMVSPVAYEAADRIEKLETALREIGDGAVADNADDAYHVLMKIARKTLGDRND